MRLTRLTITICAVIALISVLASPAQAHYVYEKGELYKSADVCVDGRAEVSHGDGGGYTRADVWSETRGWIYNVGWVNCQTAWNRPAGYMALRYDYLVFDLYYGTWGVCRELGWQYNSGSWSHMATAWNFGTWTPCGTAWYATLAFSFVRNGSDWFGGQIVSGNHWLANPALAAPQSATAQPSLPAWVRKDGTVDQAKIPSQLPVIGEDGRVRLDKSGAPVLTSISKTPSLVSDAELSRQLNGAQRSVVTENGVSTEVVQMEPQPPAT